ncbi:hypothetical protein EVAR_88712_1 [Eumeta japonica]|uniref:Uncharacterized protein n=1 Tax=Eumeta variegata TaxID=151549 RepID=A0A4C1XHL5_EUMVA|nr:hypothetical protein EVAR_88712_1 [Eumeta japonica]
MSVPRPCYSAVRCIPAGSLNRTAFLRRRIRVGWRSDGVVPSRSLGSQSFPFYLFCCGVTKTRSIGPLSYVKIEAIRSRLYKARDGAGIRRAVILAMVGRGAIAVGVPYPPATRAPRPAEARRVEPLSLRAHSVCNASSANFVTFKKLVTDNAGKFA